MREGTPSNPLETNMNFLVAGLVRNCAAQLANDVKRLRSALSQSNNLQWLLIESDSSDNSRSVLEDLTNEIAGFRFISLGNLENDIPRRTERMAYCRNTYLNELSDNPTYRNITHVIVSDFDGLNTHLTKDAVWSCWERTDWDVCTANQRGPYYDIWALRHKDWCPNDCWAQYAFLKQYNRNTKKTLYASVYSKMIEIPTDGDWIEVDSAFGGLAIYKRDAIEMARYIGLNENGEDLCEHVLFHRTLKQRGCRIFINPKMINAEYTEHSEQLLYGNKILRALKSSVKKTLIIVLGGDCFDKLTKRVRKPRTMLPR
jgi:hypothetical protein